MSNADKSADIDRVVTDLATAHGNECEPVGTPDVCPGCGHPWHESSCPVATSPGEIRAFPSMCHCIEHEYRFGPATALRLNIVQKDSA